MWSLLVLAAAGGVVGEASHPFFADALDALVHWAGLLPFAVLLAYVLVGRWKKGMTVLWRPSWSEWRRILVAAPLGLLALRLLVEDDAAWRWLFGGMVAAMVTLAVLRGVCLVRDRRRRTTVYGTVTPDRYA